MNDVFILSCQYVFTLPVLSAWVRTFLDPSLAITLTLDLSTDASFSVGSSEFTQLLSVP